MTQTRRTESGLHGGRRAAVLAAAVVGVGAFAACSNQGVNASPSARTSAPFPSTAPAPSAATSSAASSGVTATSAGTSRAPGTSSAPTPSPTSRPGAATGSATVVRTLATGLDVPWGLALTPDRRAVLVTTRDDATVRSIDLTTGRVTVLGRVPEAVSGIAQQGEGGLLGIAVSPRFAGDRTLFLYYSTRDDNRIATVRWDRGAPDGQQLSAPRALVDGIPHGVHHNGGGLAFGPDGMLYASTGEAGDRPLAQDRGSLGGKVLRMTPDGRPAPGNPFGTLVWSYGHRNVEGLAWDASGRLWASEFGDHLHDELNLVRRGGNHGWPQTEGRTDEPGIVSPVAQWGPAENSPSGVAIAAGSAWLAGLRGERLWRVPLDGASVAGEPQSLLRGEHGRLRSVLAVDDRTLLVTTSNRDGRTTPGAGDDRVLVVRVS